MGTVLSRSSLLLPFPRPPISSLLSRGTSGGGSADVSRNGHGRRVRRRSSQHRRLHLPLSSAVAPLEDPGCLRHTQLARNGTGVVAMTRVAVVPVPIACFTTVPLNARAAGTAQRPVRCWRDRLPQ